MITLAYGTEIEDITYKTLAASDISSYLKPNFRVAIKPNLVVSRPASDGATTHPEVVAGILRFLREYGVREISIIESSWIGDDTRRAFQACGYEPLRKRFGVSLVDLKGDECESREFGGIKMKVCRRAVETDFLINVPVLKAHCQTRLTCSMKNLKGCIPDDEKRRFHTIGLHKPIAALNGIIKTGYCVVDGICGDLTFEEGGNPFYANRVIAGRNPVTVDSFCAELIGYAPGDIEHLNYAKKFALGEFFSPEMPVTELFSENKPAASKKSTRLASKFEKSIDERGACSACYAALVFALHRLGGTREKICIGQGFRDKNEVENSFLGIGTCTRGFARHVTGCPPKATEIIKILEENK